MPVRIRKTPALLLSVLLSFSLFSTTAFSQQAAPGDVAAFDSAGDDVALAAAERIGGTISISIELDDEPTAIVYQRAIAASTPAHGRVDPTVRANANAVAKRHLGQIKKAQDSVLAALQDPSIDAKVFFKTQRTFNGFGAFVAADRVAKIRGIAGVKAVHLLVPQKPDNAGSVPFIGAPAAWIAGIGSNHGEGIKVGVIDTGIDYLHTNFGGPGGGYAANNTTIASDTPGVFPGPKVAGGWDFVGNNYDAGSTDPAKLTPVPDADPMDCAGHGSHVSGTIGGYGVKPDGSTYSGPYDGTTPFSSLKIGPGVAPAAQLYALRVFGCSGSTLMTTPAIEWAVDPNGDGDFSDHLDVINMSLGSSFGSPFDSSAVASDNAIKAGVIVVASAGNAGDTHYIVGSPGSSAGTLTVAASQDNGFPAISINSPASIAGLKPIGKSSGWGGALTDPGFTAPVVATVPADACSAITNLSAVAGKIAFVNRGGTAPGGAACGFELKAKNAQNAGAVGVVIGNVTTSSNPLIPITMGSSAIGGVTIPAVEMGLDAANEIRNNLAAGITATFLRSATTSLAAAGDLMASFSSRGVRRVDNLLKPDISAPGLAIDSTLALSGNDSVELQGTSMAAPHMAGSMALLRQLHPDWSVEELKALVMNTAAHDIFVNVNQTPPRFATGRIGAGRVDLATAVNDNVVAMNTNGDGSISVSFGAMEVVNTATATRTIQVVNKGTTTQTFAVALASTNHLPGVAYSLPDGNSITVAPGETATLRVQLDATASSMKHPLDATMGATQANTGGTAITRQYISEESAYVVLTPAAGQTLRVPVHAILRPASAMTAAPTAFLLANATGTNTLTLGGSQLNTGTTGSDERSLVSVLELQATSPDLGSSNAAVRAADIKAVGVTSDALARGSVTSTSTNVYFGIAAYGRWTTLTDVEFDIYVDTNRDGADDFVFFNTAQVNSPNRIDVPGTSILKLPAGTTVPGSVFSFINGLLSTTGTLTGPLFDTVPYNSSVIVLPVRAVDLGLTATNSKFNYRVVSFARGVGGSVDTVNGTYDPLHPGLNLGAAGVPIYFDFNNSTIGVQYNTAALNALGSKGVLLLHHHNADGARDQEILASAPTATTTSVAAASGQYSDAVVLTASVTPSSFFGQTVSGSVEFKIDGATVGSASVDATGTASLTYTITLPAGAHSIAASFTSANGFFLNSSATAALTVLRENANVAPSATNATSVQVTAAGGTASSVVIAADITEVADGSLGNISFAAPVTITLSPVGPGATLTQTATLSVSGVTSHASATFTNLPVNVYDISFTIGGNYYTGGASSVLAVFDPSLGNVTGGGTLTHNGVPANFGFNIKYLKNGQAQGSLLYIEHRPAGDLKVKSNAMDTLSIAGNTGIALGKATVADAGNYAFRLTAVDNGEPGSADQFGLKITKNNSDITDLTFGPVTLSGGNIQVPQPK